MISRSGGMTTEMSSTLSAAGLGQSTAVSIGGDAIIGSSYAELMPLFEADEQTQGIVIYTEPGGRMEAELARWVTEQHSRLPIVAFMAGRFMDEMPGMSFGHAGTIVEGKEDTASEKIARLAQAGIAVAERIEDIPEIIRNKMVERSAGSRHTQRACDTQRARREEGRHLHRGRGRRRHRRGPAIAAKLAEVCPVDIFAAADDGRVEIVETNLDECVLCRLCLDATDSGSHAPGARDQALRRRRGAVTASRRCTIVRSEP